MGHEFVVHTVITGSQALVDTVNGFAQLVTQFPAECLFVVWLTPYWGPIEDGGKSYEQMKSYTAKKARVTAIIKIPVSRQTAAAAQLCQESFPRSLPAATGASIQSLINIEEACMSKKQRMTVTKNKARLDQPTGFFGEGWLYRLSQNLYQSTGRESVRRFIKS
jgi:hypothetical protein